MDRQNPQLQSSDGSGDRPRIAASGSVSFVFSLSRKAMELIKQYRKANIPLAKRFTWMNPEVEAYRVCT